MKSGHTMKKLEFGEWQALGGRFMAALLKEFKAGKEWESLPSVMVLMGSVMLMRDGVAWEDISNMVTEYESEVKRVTKEDAN